MKKISTVFSLILGVSIMSATTLVQGQRSDDRRRGEAQRDHDDRDRNDNNNDQSDRNNDKRGHWDNGNNHNNGRGQHQNNNHQERYSYDRRYDYNYNNGRGNNHRTVVIHNVYKRPRYIYYRDYDVYYDCRNNAYISHSGRNWFVSPIPPHMMRHVNLRTTRSYEVDYWDDDFPTFLDRRRPTVGREYGW